MSTSNLPTPQVSAPQDLSDQTEQSDQARAVTLLPLADASAGDTGSCCGGSCHIG